MSMTKDSIAAALRAVRTSDGRDLISAGCFQWSAVCDTYVSIKLHLDEPAGDARDETFERVAIECAAVIKSLAHSSGGTVESLTIEFVDDHGGVLATARPITTTNTEYGKAGVRTASAGDPASAGTPVRIQVPPPGPAMEGHRPIGGLGNPSLSSHVGVGAAGGASAGVVGGSGGGGGSTGKAPTPQAGLRSLPGIRHAIAVGAGKGGVGKSTIAVNLAIGLARRGHAVGLMDGDIYGPSLPTMLGLGGMDAVTHEGKLQPFVRHGIKSMTIGKLVDPQKPLIWRGPMAHGAFKQLSELTNWGELDYLVIDLPPGTGDVSLTMAQTIQLAGAVIVCTPQKVAQDDAVRAVRMFQQLGIDVLGVVENMSYFIGDDGKEYDLFGRGGAEMMAQRLGIPFLGAVPITTALRGNSDRGEPTANFTPGTDLVRSFEEMVRNFESQLALASMRRGSTRPTLSIS